MIEIIIIFNLIQDSDLTIKMSIEIEVSSITEIVNRATGIFKAF
jgi:hypothetical protein